ncbi:MAG: hypothetical protein A2469_04510 [Candidatus Magasanikbacteria bacterium RIFOXYC2_FULL_40_16]|uniref:FCP1 homology domain-containing protein n=3 Tax=Candidatus Magasanikiibacteriota TaxID=1752731 RepID=A0A1F6NEI8_9BACT|nr:MAG: hypothetical protein A2224_00225 [Candidatus Magasanikbacteria bacterium RIFOXYA2_FULL_40_20]OGH82304.1 MAG: hypothetical protein A2373_02285 [Candidatus Magasanikbacteria bacterium RIFOXYB1_FULL_40_15]OGH86389.1 MAG: hypothetical protein A2301_00525 [Candidatus Magasanikbacteria bacterium RIFOXYB2_FULL_40_13]OGH87399.1 MAG: hypothetical protein A2206_01695 [Candidatus Magasanikbacteria bacterium RIFOXYA1_FULL_40_8]OGH89431.1 MAG: hypothetical protein A2469_04510 [Candidatus Magasanikba
MNAIIFDFDGVIHDTFELAYETSTRIFGKELSREEYKNFFNGNIYERAEIDEENSKIFFEMQDEVFGSLELKAETKIFLEKLTEKYSLFIITSNQEKTLNAYFQKSESTHIFKDIFGFETHTSKVKKFEQLFEKHNLKNDDCVFITDTLGDILEGHKAGVKSIAVDFGFHDRERLEKGNPHKIVSNFDEMLEAIEEIMADKKNE